MTRTPIILLILLALGGLASFDYAPLNIYYLYPLSLGAFTHIIWRKTPSPQRTIMYGGVYFFSHYGVGMAWVAQSFFTVGMGSMSPLAFIGLPLALAVLPTLGCVVAVMVARTSTRIVQCCALGLGLSLAFLMQCVGELACPWLIPGYTLPLPLLQGTAWIGIEGVSVVVCILSCLLASKSRVIILNILALTLALYYAGDSRLSHNPPQDTSTRVRIVQACIPQIQKWNAEKVQENLYLHADLSQTPSNHPIQAVIWPEAAVVFDFTHRPDLCAMFGCAAPQGGYVMMGAVTEHGPSTGLKSPRNSMVVVRDDGIIAGRCDKQHLLPFGEYIPGRRYLPWLPKMTVGEIDMTPGSGPRVMILPGLPPVRPLICYEALFSREMGYAQSGEPRALWFLNLTNDAWFGDSWGPHQHLKHVSVRTIEQGIPMVRAANNGISAVIDGYGRTIHSLPLNRRGVLDAPLPRPLDAPTFYSRHGRFMWEWMTAFILIILSFIFIRRKNKKY